MITIPIAFAFGSSLFMPSPSEVSTSRSTFVLSADGTPPGKRLLGLVRMARIRRAISLT